MPTFSALLASASHELSLLPVPSLPPAASMALHRFRQKMEPALTPKGLLKMTSPAPTPTYSPHPDLTALIPPHLLALLPPPVVVFLLDLTAANNRAIAVCASISLHHTAVADARVQLQDLEVMRAELATTFLKYRLTGLIDGWMRGKVVTQMEVLQGQIGVGVKMLKGEV